MMTLALTSPRITGDARVAKYLTRVFLRYVEMVDGSIIRPTQSIVVAAQATTRLDVKNVK